MLKPIDLSLSHSQVLGFVASQLAIKRVLEIQDPGDPKVLATLGSLFVLRGIMEHKTNARFADTAQWAEDLLKHAREV